MGLFNLEDLNKLVDGDILEAPITESAEFTGDPSSDPTKEVEGAVIDPKGPTPNGTPEKPGVSTYDGEHGPTPPGGLNEKPDAKPYTDGYTTVAEPAKVQMDEDTYNKAINTLKQSFKEAYELMDTISKCQVITESVEDKQQKFVEEALDEAFYNSYMEGPIFESVNKSDKDEVKAIVNDLKKKIKRFALENDADFNEAKTFFRLLLNLDINEYGWRAGDNNTDEKSKYGTNSIRWWSTRFWQVLGVVYCEGTDIKTLVNKLNEEFKDELKGYNILFSKSFPNLYDLICNKFGWKNRNKTYFLIVDKKKKFDTITAKELAEIDKVVKEKSENKVEEVTTESCEFEVSLEEDFTE